MHEYLTAAPRRDTIFAPASGVGRAAVAVIRISGPGSDAAIRALTFGAPLLEERHVYVRVLRDPKTEEILDRGIVVRFAAPRSFTGEDMAEIHVTGGRAVLSGVLASLSRVPDLRPSEPGEFAWRAFENGKLDLSEAEGLADLVDAETAAQRRQALRVSGGALRREAEAIQGILLQAMTTMEGLIDFADMEDANMLHVNEAQALVRAAGERIRLLLAPGKAGIRMRDGLVVVIAGPPNVGKSTLMNALAMRDVSIVSSSPGTTRDLLEVPLDLAGYPVTLVDTAGIRDSSDPVELEGIARARRRAMEGDLTLWLDEIGAQTSVDLQLDRPHIRVLTKSDRHPNIGASDALSISAKSGAGLPELVDRIAEFAAAQFEAASGSLITTERVYTALRDAEIALERIGRTKGESVELVAEDLRLGARALERIGGRIEIEDVLGAVFGRLCVGK